jgi:DNA/RNA non-specific endonuclease
MYTKQVQPGFEIDGDLFMIHDYMRARPIAVRGFVSGPHKGKSRTADVPLAAIAISGASQDARIPNTEAGHVIALELGGADASENLVPMYGNVNRGTYRALEAEIGQRIQGATKPAVLVQVNYPPLKIFEPDDSRIPTRFDVYFFKDVADLKTLRPNPLSLVRSIPNTKEEPARMAIEGSDIELRRKLIEIRNAFALKKWRAESVPDFAKYNLPPLDQRPNAWLDYLIYTNDEIKTARAMLSKVAQSGFTVGPGWGFVEPQRDFVVLANRMTQSDERKGECWSDAAEDPVGSALTSLGTDDGIHIDHIIPEASLGPNIYSNAAVTSARYNKEKGRISKKKSAG